MAEGTKVREMTSVSDMVKVNDFVTVGLANTPGGIWLRVGLGVGVSSGVKLIE
jgi:hypothetical protein